MKIFTCLAGLSLVAGLTPAALAAPADEAYLDGLKGKWTITGTTRGKPTVYDAEGERVLDGGFLKLHMRGAASTSDYVADVYIGYDAAANDYVAHWLDKTGASGARVVATGKRAGNRMIVVFPYAEGNFRDTFTLNSKTGNWTLLLEAQDEKGAWSTFADYTLTRP